MAPQNILVELFADFIRLRQVGYAPEKAWQALRPRIAALSEQDVARLHALLRGWEAREGRHYQVAGALSATPEHPDERVERVRTSLSEGVQQAENGEAIGEDNMRNPITRPVEPDRSLEESYEQKRHLIRRIGAGGQPPAGAREMTSCPVCQQQNRPGEIYCMHCGTLLIELDETASKAGQTMPISPAPMQGTYFTDGMVLQIRVRGSSEPIEIVPREDSETVLGRTSSDSVVSPDVDLTPHSAQTYGVSRLHASLRRRGNTVLLSDMGSLNYTFLNGQRLHTHEQRILSDGDEIRLGHLTMRVFFREEV